MISMSNYTSLKIVFFSTSVTFKTNLVNRIDGFDFYSSLYNYVTDRALAVIYIVLLHPGEVLTYGKILAINNMMWRHVLLTV